MDINEHLWCFGYNITLSSVIDTSIANDKDIKLPTKGSKKKILTILKSTKIHYVWITHFTEQSTLIKLYKFMNGYYTHLCLAR